MEIEIKKKEASEIIAEALVPLVRTVLLMYLAHQGIISRETLRNECQKGLAELNQKPKDKNLPMKYDKILTN